MEIQRKVKENTLNHELNWSCKGVQAITSNLKGKKLSNNSTWDFEHIFDIKDLFELCPGQNFVYSSLVFFENPD